MGPEGIVSIAARKLLQGAESPEAAKAMKTRWPRRCASTSRLPNGSAGDVDDVIDPRDTRRSIYRALKRTSTRRSSRPYRRREISAGIVVGPRCRRPASVAGAFFAGQLGVAEETCLGAVERELRRLAVVGVLAGELVHSALRRCAWVSWACLRLKGRTERETRASSRASDCQVLQ